MHSDIPSLNKLSGHFDPLESFLDIMTKDRISLAISKMHTETVSQNQSFVASKNSLFFFKSIVLTKILLFIYISVYSRDV